MLPSANWIFWISVASLEYPSAQPHVSTRTNCISIDLIATSVWWTVTVPVKAFVTQNSVASKRPVIRNLGIVIRSFAVFCNVSGEIVKLTSFEEKCGFGCKVKLYYVIKQMTFKSNYSHDIVYRIAVIFEHS